MAKESRKLKRSGGRTPSDDKPSAESMLAKQAEQTQTLGAEAQRSMFIRLGLIMAAMWLVGGLIAAMSQSPMTTGLALGLPGILSVVLVGVGIWALRRAKSAQGVAGILANVKDASDRKKALEQLDAQFKDNDAAAIFAKAQLQMQEDPRTALETLEKIDLNKAIATVADEARSQRGMIHLMLGEATKARDLVDAIDLSRHTDSRSKAMMSSVICEAWARTGQAKKGLKMIEVFNPEDEMFEQLRPQLYRARAYACAYANDPKGMRKALRKLAQIDARLLGGMLVKKSHPLLQKEARQLLEQSGQMPRKMQFQRM